ncbi:unnamed protein product [Rotaria magnacalcarata]|uniref:Uncharacterized protein n=2 Tax=Rotaria magnacalcarata TaxID=392030 RepID=A0A815HE93_9BILA|nr:unnamed protein product [Rotaria magnacalcarata]CAF1577453.1 unnamed protein product [Rotaria magnacalcarata]CAF2098471.1 unnamed protein product [Rotaria magnacalcarata]CAF2114866.1 unnamed protein product [Rotaria magnacalcarata]CAF2125487.1 unnamed protein product [Rotaria magnacalcarata]
MGTDSKTAIQQPSSKVALVSSSSSAKNIKKKKSKTSHHKSKHNKQQRSESSSSQSSNEYERNTTSSSSKKPIKAKHPKEKNKLSSTIETRNHDKKLSNNKKKPHRSKHDSSESPPKRNNATRSRSKSRSRSDRSSDRSSSRESPSRYRQKNSIRRLGSNMQNVYSPMGHTNFPPNMPRHYAPPNALHTRDGRMLPYMPPSMIGGPPMRHNNGHRRSGGNSPPQSLLGGYRPPPGNFRGRGGSMNNPAYIHNMASMLNLIQQQQQQQQLKQKPGAQKFANPNNPNNRFYQQFQDNYKKISSGQKVSNLYQASFPVQHIPREMRFNFRLLGRNIFTASDEEEEEAEKKKAAAAEKRSKQRRDSSSSSESSDTDRRKRRDDDNGGDEKPTNSKSKSSPQQKTSGEQKRSSTKNNRNRPQATANVPHAKAMAPSHDLLADSNDFSSLLAGIMHGENSEALAHTIVNAAAAVNSKRERTKKQQEKKVQKFKNYARFQQIQASAGGVTPQTNPEEVEKKIHGLARRLQMKTIGLHDDYESQGIKRSDESSGDSDTNQRRHRSSGSSSDRSKDKDAGSDASTNSQKQRKLKKTTKKNTRKVNAAGQIIGSSDSEQHRSDGNDSDGSMLNLNEDLKTISYYIKERERMLREMFRCVRGHKLQAILPDALKTRSFDEIKAKCLDQLDILSKKRIRAILLAQPMTSSSGTEDSTDEDDQDFFTLYPHLKSSLDPTNNNATTPNTSATAPSADNNKKPLTNSKFRPVPMQVVTDNNQTSTVHTNLFTPAVVGGDEDVNDYYEGFKRIRKLANLRRNEQDDEFFPFPDQNGKLLQPIRSSQPKFEFKPITGLTHSQQAHLAARRAANRQQQQNEIRQEIDDLLNIDDFVLPDGDRPLSSAELSSNQQRHYGLPPRLHHKIPVGPPKKGSLGHLLKKSKQSGDRSPSPMVDERNLKRRRQDRRRSQSLSSTGSAQWSRSSSLSNNDDRVSRHSSREMTPSLDNNHDEKPDINSDDITDMNDLSKLLDLNEEDELLLLQIEVEQEERNMRREEKRRRKGEKKSKKTNKKIKPSSSTDSEKIIQQCLHDLLEDICLQQDNTFKLKRTFDSSDDELSKKIKLNEKS